MGRWLVLVVLACGCRQLWGLGTPERAIDAGVDVPDAPPDVMVDAPLCFGTFGDAPYCLTARPTDPLTISQGMNIDTKSSMCAPEITSVCVIAATTIDVAAHVTATGELPLVLIATDTLNVTATGIVDVSSHRGGKRGAGSGATSCDVGQNPGAGGGGQGGSFGGAGGNGGDSSGNGGRAGMTIVPSVLRAGCDGQDGGGGGGANGIGGGAMYLIAGSSITIAGLVNASGSGGGGTSAAIRGGGGGGGGGAGVIKTLGSVISNLLAVSPAPS